MDFKRWSRTILKDVVGERLTHDCPCSRQTGKRFRRSYTSEKNDPQTQPTNKQAIEFDLQLASQSGHQNEPRPITSTYIKTLVLPANDLYEDPALVTCSESVPILHPPVGQQKRLRLPTFSQQRKPAAARIANKQVCKQLEIANIFRLGPGSYPVPKPWNILDLLVAFNGSCEALMQQKSPFLVPSRQLLTGLLEPQHKT